MFVTIEQIKAARALLKWTQKDLAQNAGLNDDQVHSFESGRTRSLEVLESIYGAISAHGIEFIDEGVKRKTGNITVYHGHDGFNQFRRDVLAAAQAGPIDICVSNVDERNFAQWGHADVNDHYRAEMAKLQGLTFRIIVKKGDKNLIASQYAEYRWADENDFGDIPFYIFGDKTAIIPFQENELDIFILDHSLITKFYRHQFEINWENAEPVS